jgi:hypothetical protein
MGSTATYGSTSASGKFVLPSAVDRATRAAHVGFPPSGLSGTRTTAPAVNVVASATDEPATKTMAPPNGGASHLANGSLKLDLMTLIPPLDGQLVAARQDGAPSVLGALRLRVGRGQRPRTARSLRATIPTSGLFRPHDFDETLPAQWE